MTPNLGLESYSTKRYATLYQKIRQFVPVANRDQLCPDPLSPTESDDETLAAYRSTEKTLSEVKTEPTAHTVTKTNNATPRKVKENKKMRIFHAQSKHVFFSKSHILGCATSVSHNFDINRSFFMRFFAK